MPGRAFLSSMPVDVQNAPPPLPVPFPNAAGTSRQSVAASPLRCSGSGSNHSAAGYSHANPSQTQGCRYQYRYKPDFLIALLFFFSVLQNFTVYCFFFPGKFSSCSGKWFQFWIKQISSLCWIFRLFLVISKLANNDAVLESACSQT